jgi:hypothetical protein
MSHYGKAITWPFHVAPNVEQRSRVRTKKPSNGFYWLLGATSLLELSRSWLDEPMPAVEQPLSQPNLP